MVEMAVSPDEMINVEWIGNVSMDDQLWHRSIKAFEHMNSKRGSDLTDDEKLMFWLINMGVVDQDRDFDKPWPASVRSMRHSAVIGDVLWKLQEKEKTRVSRSSRHSARLKFLTHFQGDRLEQELRELQKFTTAMKASDNERDRFLDKEIDSCWKRMSRHREQIDDLRRDLTTTSDLVVAQAREIADLKLRVCRCAEKRSGSPGSSKEVAIAVEDSEIEYADDGRAVESPDEYHTPPIAHAVAELALAEEVNQVQAEILPMREPVQVRSTFASVFQPTLMSAIPG